MIGWKCTQLFYLKHIKNKSLMQIVVLVLHNLEIQWKLLNVIGLGNSKTDSINQMITITEDFYSHLL